MQRIARPCSRPAPATHVGKVRQRNEDRYLGRPDVGLWAVADGMGGHEAGDFASQTIVEALRCDRALRRRPPNCWRAARSGSSSATSACARSAASAAARSSAPPSPCCSTFERHYACVWSGDSRIYLVRGGAIAQLSRDHTEVQELARRGRDHARGGEELARQQRRHPRDRRVRRSRSWRSSAARSNPATAFVICSDGLTQHVEDEEILGCVSSARFAAGLRRPGRADARTRGASTT